LNSGLHLGQRVRALKTKLGAHAAKSRRDNSDLDRVLEAFIDNRTEDDFCVFMRGLHDESRCLVNFVDLEI
jgi:hypothetical protein